MADVFISYSRSDRPIAERLAAALEAQGISYWMDSHLAGGSTFTKVTEEELDEAGKVVVLWSETSVESGWVCDEAQAAREQGKLVPLSIDGSQPPMGFRQIQTIDVSAWAKGTQANPPPGLLHGLGHPAAASEPSATPPASKPAARRRNLVIAAIAAGVLLLGGAIWFFAGQNPSSSESSADVTVMPLAPIGSEPDEAALAAGITEELIQRLRRIPELQVFSGTSGDEPEGNVLQGSVRKDGDQLRVSARLETPDGKVLWSENFDRQISDVFEVQEGIAVAVANALSVSLNVGIDSRAYGGTDNPEAYADYFQARVLRYTPDRDRFLLLERAIELDPDYIRAQTELAYAYGNQLISDNSREKAAELLAKMGETSARALELNPDLWFGHAARAWYEVTIGDLSSADNHQRLVKRLDDGRDPELRDELANFQDQLGRFKRANDLRHSIALIDPAYSLNLRGPADEAFLSGNYEEAIRRFEQLRKKQPNLAPIFFDSYFWAVLLSGDRAKARELAQEASNFDPVYLIGLDGRYDPAIFPNLPLPRLREWAEEKYHMGGRPQLISRAMVAANLDNLELAMDYLRLAFERPADGYYVLIWHPALAELRKTDAFRAWLVEIGMVDAWRKSGDWGDYCKPGSETEITCV